jgi:hypothetical protein
MVWECLKSYCLNINFTVKITVKTENIYITLNALVNSFVNLTCKWTGSTCNLLAHINSPFLGTICKKFCRIGQQLIDELFVDAN